MGVCGCDEYAVIGIIWSENSETVWRGKSLGLDVEKLKNLIIFALSLN